MTYDRQRRNALASLIRRAGRLISRSGIGALQITVQPHGTSHPRGTDAVVSVRVIANFEPVQIRGIIVVLLETIAQGRSSTQRILASDIKFKGATVIPGHWPTATFELPIPDDARLTFGDHPGRSGARTTVSVSVKTTGSLFSQKAIAYLTITPHVQVTAAYDAMAAAGFVETEWSKAYLATRDQDPILRKTFLPPERYRDRLDNISLNLGVLDDNLAGTMILNYKEKSFAEYVRSMVGGNRESFNVLLPFSAVMPGGKPDPKAAAALFIKLLDDALNSENRAADQLLRGSSPPADRSAELLRPAKPGADTDPGDLVRPSEQPPGD